MLCKKSSALALIAGCLSLSLMGCSASSRQSVVPRFIPGPPAYLAPVMVRDPALGEDPYQIAARERAGRLQANRVIVNGAAEWDAVAREFAQ